MSVIKNRYDFMVIYDAKDCNPNGDPDANGMPRQDSETSLGRVTDVCLKRKIRDYVDLVKEGEAGYDIYVRGDVALNRNDKKAYYAIGVEDVEDDSKRKKNVKNVPDIDMKITDYMCKTFFDIRAFGQVMTTFKKDGLSCSQIRGPVQIGVGHSIDPVSIQELTITRKAVTKESDKEDKQNAMGSKFIIPYGLYLNTGHIDACWAEKETGFSEEDLELFWDAILNMFEHSNAASRSDMSVCKLIIFKHESKYGNIRARKLFDSVKIARKPGVDVPRSFDDYEITLPDMLPKGVTIEVRD